jgi:hypothetical protein
LVAGLTATRDTLSRCLEASWFFIQTLHSLADRRSGYMCMTICYSQIAVTLPVGEDVKLDSPLAKPLCKGLPYLVKMDTSKAWNLTDTME